MKKLQESEILIHPHDHKTKKDWKRILAFLDNNLDPREMNSFLDLGAGLGNLASFILMKNPNCKAVCQDINPDYLRMISQKNPKIQILCGDINQSLPFEDQKFDLVSCIGTLHYSYLKNPEKVFQEMIRISKKYILVDCFSKHLPWTLIAKIFFPENNSRKLSRSQAKKIFRKHNLKIIDKTGTRTPFPKLFPFSGKLVLFLLEK